MTQKSEEDEARELAREVFQKCMLVLLAHVQRRIADDESYQEPRFLRAMIVAYYQINDELKDGETVMGVSVSDENEDPQEGYAVILKKHKNFVEIVSHQDIILNTEISITNLLKLIELSIRLDNIDTKAVKWSVATEMLNKLVPDMVFIKFPNNQWKQGRDELLKEIWKGRIHGLTPFDPMVAKVKAATSFSEVPQVLRQFIATLYAARKSPGKNALGISSPDKDIDKAKVFELARIVLYGPGSKYRKDS